MRKKGFTQHQKRSTPMRFGAGFTLVESMVAVTIIAIAVGGPLYAASRALVAAQISRDKLTASYLAQEGIEYIRKSRDDWYLRKYTENSSTASVEGWKGFSTGALHQRCLPAYGGCWVDPMSDSIGKSCSTYSDNKCPPLYLTDQGQYRHTDDAGYDLTEGVQSIFTRSIDVETVDSNTEKVTSTVSWTSRGTPYSVTVTDHLTAWQ